MAWMGTFHSTIGCALQKQLNAWSLIQATMWQNLIQLAFVNQLWDYYRPFGMGNYAFPKSWIISKLYLVAYTLSMFRKPILKLVPRVQLMNDVDTIENIDKKCFRFKTWRKIILIQKNTSIFSFISIPYSKFSLKLSRKKARCIHPSKLSIQKSQLVVMQ